MPLTDVTVYDMKKKKKKEKGQSLDNSGIPEFTLQATNRA